VSIVAKTKEQRWRGRRARGRGRERADARERERERERERDLAFSHQSPDLIRQEGFVLLNARRPKDSRQLLSTLSLGERTVVGFDGSGDDLLELSGPMHIIQSS